VSDSLEASMMKRIGELKAENARLKSEVERLTKANKWLLGQGNHMCDSLEESGKDECLTQSWREITAKEVQP
jgi:hypothetical protein